MQARINKDLAVLGLGSKIYSKGDIVAIIPFRAWPGAQPAATVVCDAVTGTVIALADLDMLEEAAG